MEDSKGERMGIVGFRMVKGCLDLVHSNRLKGKRRFIKAEERDEEWSQEDMNVVLQ